MNNTAKWQNSVGLPAILVDHLPLSEAANYITGTLFQQPSGQTWRVSGGVFKRITKVGKPDQLRAGESRWAQPIGEREENAVREAR